jgi:uncharacterized protein YkwD
MLRHDWRKIIGTVVGGGLVLAGMASPGAAVDAPAPDLPAVDAAEPGERLGEAQPDDGSGQSVSGPTFQGVVPAIDTSSQTAVADAYANILTPALHQQVDWNGSINPCSAGTINTEAQNAVFTAVNYFRRMAGLNTVYEDSDASKVARKTALMMIAQGDLSHTPPQSWACWTNNGAHIANRSNLALGHTGAEAVMAYVDDFGSNNLNEVGHRRWILSPGQQAMGAGSTTGVKIIGNTVSYNGSNALVWGSPAGSCSGSACDGSAWKPSEGDAFFTIGRTSTWSTPEFVTWPSAGYFPYQLADGRGSERLVWSVSTGSASVGFANAQVTVTKNNLSVGTVTPIRRGAAGSTGYGDRAVLLFQLPAGVMTQRADGAADIYHVKISNITGRAAALEYDVKVFDVKQVTLDPHITGYPWVGGQFWYAAGASPVTPAGAGLSYQWLRDNKPIAGQTGSTYTVTAADRGHVVALRVTASTAGYVPTVATSGWYYIDQSLSSAQAQTCPAPKVGQICAATGTSTPPTPSADKTYRWFVGSTVVGTGASYTPKTGDLNKALKVEVKFDMAGYEAATVTSAARTVAKAPVVVGSSTPPGSCGLSQVVVSPRLTSSGGSPTGSGPGSGQVVRVCRNGDLWLYELGSSNRLTGLGRIASGWSGVRFYAPGDWDKDGWNDLIGIDGKGDMWLYGRTSSDTFKARVKIGRSWGSFRAVVPVGDVTSDGNPDLLAVAKTGVMCFYAGNGRGGWLNPHGTKNGTGWQSVSLLPAGDVTGDGRADIVGITSNGDLYSFRGLGTGQFTGKTKVGWGWRGVSATGGASLDGDLNADLIGVDRSGAVSFYRGNGRAGFSTIRGAATGWK